MSNVLAKPPRGNVNNAAKSGPDVSIDPELAGVQWTGNVRPLTGEELEAILRNASMWATVLFYDDCGDVDPAYVMHQSGSEKRAARAAQADWWNAMTPRERQAALDAAKRAGYHKATPSDAYRHHLVVKGGAA